MRPGSAMHLKACVVQASALVRRARSCVCALAMDAAHVPASWQRIPLMCMLPPAAAPCRRSERRAYHEDACTRAQQRLERIQVGAPRVVCASAPPLPVSLCLGILAAVLCPHKSGGAQVPALLTPPRNDFDGVQSSVAFWERVGAEAREHTQRRRAWYQQLAGALQGATASAAARQARLAGSCRAVDMQQAPELAPARAEGGEPQEGAGSGAAPAAAATGGGPVCWLLRRRLLAALAALREQRARAAEGAAALDMWLGIEEQSAAKVCEHFVCVAP